MTANPQAALRMAGWQFGKGYNSMFHPCGAVVRARLGLYSAERPDGSKRHGIVNRDTAASWALGADDVKSAAPVAVAKTAAAGSPCGRLLPDGWTGGRGLYRHARGSVESGHASNRFMARLTSGEKELFRLREDAFVWVKNGGTFPAGHVRDERKSP